MSTNGDTTLAPRLVPGIYPIGATEFDGGEGLGWIGQLIDSRAWPARRDWPVEVREAVFEIQAAGSSLGQAGLHARNIRDRKAARLGEILRAHDPIYILGRMAQSAVFDREGFRDWYAIHGLQSLVEYAIGVAYALPQPQVNLAKPPDSDIQEAYDAVAEIFAIDWFLVQFSGDESLPPHISRAQAQFRMERLIDRWQGYVVHLTRILRETFARIDRYAVAELGWSPSILPEISGALRSILQRRMDAFHPAAHRRIRAAGAAGRKRYNEAVMDLLREHGEFARRLFIVTPNDLAVNLGLPEETLRAALSDLSHTPGSQPDFAVPTQDNLVRLYSIVHAGENEYFAWLPGALVQESHTWFYDLLQRRGLESLRERYLAARDAVTEDLTRTSLCRVFGSERTFGPAYYSAEGRPDVDCVVVVPRDALVAECKAHLMTAAGRRGAPGRLSTKFDELVSKPARQAARFVSHIRSGGSAFGRRNERLPLAVDQTSVLPRIVVTYERVDPLATHGATLAQSASNEPVWVLPLADLLTVADLLPSASAFWHYATLRWLQSAEKALVVQSETDVLGLFLSDKNIFGELTRQIQSKPTTMIGPAGQEINNYYTGQGKISAKAKKKPVVAIPPLVLEALDLMLQANDSGWRETIAAVMSEPGKTWTRLRSVERKVKAARGPLRRRLVTTNPELDIWIELDSGGSYKISTKLRRPIDST